MEAPIRKIKIIGIEKEGIEDSDNFPGVYYKLPFKLSEEPDYRWQRLFENNYRTYGHSKKRNAHILNDTIVVDITKADNMQTHADIIKKIVEQTNNEVDKEDERIIASIERAKEMKKDELETIEKLKEKTDIIKF